MNLVRNTIAASLSNLSDHFIHLLWYDYESIYHVVISEIIFRARERKSSERTVAGNGFDHANQHRAESSSDSFRIMHAFLLR